jgi:hypothetical protein
MALIFDSAPECVEHLTGAVKGDEADAILQAAYQKCAGIMTFGPGSTYGEGGHTGAAAYLAITVLGMVVTAIVLIAWVLVENRRLVSHAVRLEARTAEPDGDAPFDMPHGI